MRGVINAIEVLVKDLGGVATLKALSDMVGQEAVLKALSMGYAVYNPGGDLTVRATTKALALLKQLGSESDVLGKEGRSSESS